MVYLLFDVNNLCHRAFHTTGSLSHKGIVTGVLFGVFRDILFLQELHQTENIIFCFDSGESIRKSIYPAYKANRKPPLTEKEAEAKETLYQQIEKLRTKWLPALGYRNILQDMGYEADDLIASVCVDLHSTDEAVVVSSDQDLYQLLSGRVRIWNPHKKKTITIQSFKKEYGIHPYHWPKVKAIAGCSSDNIKGIKGVGEKTAIKFHLGTLRGTKTWENIMEGNNQIEKNLRLTRLPLFQTPHFSFVKDEVTNDKWYEVLEKLGMKSLRKMLPVRKSLYS